MKRILFVASFAIMTMAASLSRAEEISQGSLDKLMTLSGITKEVSHYPDFIQMGLVQAQQSAKQQKTPLSDAEFAEIKDAMTGAFKPAGILSAVSAEVKRDVSESDAKAVLAWLESDLGRKLTKAEDDASTPAAYQDMAKSAKTLMADQKRVAFAQRMDKLLKVTDKTLQLQENLALAMFVAYSTASNPNQPPQVEAFKAKVGPALQQRRPAVEQATTLTYVYTYKDIDLASLDKYLAFLEGAEAKRFNDSVIKGIGAGFDQSISTVGKSLAGMARKHSNKKG